MSIEGTSRAGKSSPEGCGKKSREAHKRKVCLGAEEDDAGCNNEVPELDKAVLNTERANEVQSVFSSKQRKRVEKTMEDVTQQVHASREETQENGQQRGSKERKRVKFNLESTIVPSDQGKRGSMEEGTAKGQAIVHANEAREDNKPNDASWVQKASWKSLVGESGRVAFSLGSMLGHNPSLLPGGNVKSMSAGVGQPSLDVQSSNNVSAWIDRSMSTPSFESSGQSNKHLNISHTKKASQFIEKSETQNDSGPLNPESIKTTPFKGDPQRIECTKHEGADSYNAKEMVQNNCQSGVEQVCMFMRSDNYEQEWLEAKRAVKDIFKRSRKDALRSMKMFHTKHIH